tara:strand:+ start:6782 stop:8020 length:1239 start_codon:yes stop_codon:yes gene_type:complete
MTCSEEKSRSHNNDIICNSCFEENFRECEDCNEIYLLEETNWCERTGNYFCCHCEDNYYFCEDCGEYYPNGYNCEHNRGNDTIRGYDYTPEYQVFDYRRRNNKDNLYEQIPVICKDSVYQPKFNRKPTSIKNFRERDYYPKSQVLDSIYGVELEVEYKGSNYSNKEETAEKVIDMADTNIGTEFLFCMNDGSLSDGFEIGTMPFTERFYKQVLYRNSGWANILTYLKRKNYRSYNTRNCGMHVHINRQSFSDTHLYKFQRFFYTNPAFIQFIARRKDSRMEQWCQIYGIGKFDNIKAVLQKRTRKFLAVNLTPKKTVEVRIFRGTLSHKAFCRNMEFVIAIKNFTKLVSVNRNGHYRFDTSNTKQRFKGDYTDFFIWLKNQDKRYPNLVHYLDNQNIYASWNRLDKKGNENY